MTRNHNAMIGPKALPIRVVPSGWMAKSATRITTAAGKMYGRKVDVTMSSPSSAERTEIAGVMAPSP